MPCEICGKEEKLVKAMVEGIELEVCHSCGAFGTVSTQQAASRQVRKSVVLPQELEEEENIVQDVAARMKQARESKGWTQAELAQKLNEKISVLRAIETGAHYPNILLARKIEHILHITLVEKPEVAAVAKTGKEAAITIGDIIKTR